MHQMTDSPKLCACGQPTSHPYMDHCRECWAAEVQARTAAIKLAHPEAFQRRKGLRDRRYNGA